MRAFLLVMDSVGIGAAADADAFGDRGADTLGHIAAACAAGNADIPGRRSGPLAIPNMNRLGLCRAAEAASDKLFIFAPSGFPDGPPTRPDPGSGMGVRRPPSGG